MGLVLLAAAGLKLAGQAVSPFAQQGTLTAPHLQALAVVWEILLGVWLISGVYRPAAWLAAVGTFSLFAPHQRLFGVDRPGDLRLFWGDSGQSLGGASGGRGRFASAVGGWAVA